MIILEYIKLFYYLIHPKSIFVRWTSHALGDNLLLSVILPELRRKNPESKIIVESKFPELFLNNPYVNWVTKTHFKTTKNFIKPKYRILEDTTKSIYEQMLAYISDLKEGNPELFLSKNEIEKQKENFKFFVVAPIGKQAFSANRKEWGIEKFQSLVSLILENTDFKVVQIGAVSDNLLNSVIDKRGLQIRESASVMKNSIGFIGLEGGLMHLAKAVEIDSVIIYGGFINPRISQYENNINVVNLVECSPCFTSEESLSNCDTMICMKGITPESVFEKMSEKCFQGKV
jgi:ADP-heptose:LPS heptosyltransferase